MSEIFPDKGSHEEGRNGQEIHRYVRFVSIGWQRSVSYQSLHNCWLVRVSLWITSGGS